MRILLDNNIPYRFKREIADLDVTHVQDVGLKGLLDEPLLAAIDGKFDVLVTMDRNLQYQQNLSNRKFAVVVLRTKTNRSVDILPLAPALRRQLPHCTASNCYDHCLIALTTPPTTPYGCAWHRIPSPDR